MRPLLLIVIPLVGLVGAETPVLKNAFTVLNATHVLPENLRTPQTTVSDMVATPAGVFVLLSRSGLNSASAIVQLAGSGGRQRFIELPSGVTYWMDVDSQGNVLVLHEGRILTFDQEGRYSETPAGGAQAGPLFCLVDDQLVSVTGRGSVVMRKTQLVPILELEAPAAIHMVAALPGGRLVMVDSANGILYFAHIVTRTARSVRINTPELVAARAAYIDDRTLKSPGVRALLVMDVTTHGADIFVLVAGHRISDGTPVLQFDDLGNLVRRYLLAPPQADPIGDSGPVRQWWPSRLAATTDQLLVTDPSGRVAIYPR